MFECVCWSNYKKGGRKSHLAFSLAHAKIINSSPSGTGVPDARRVFRHGSRVLISDNKWGTVLGYVLQPSKPIIFDMRYGVYTVPAKTSSYTLNRVQRTTQVLKRRERWRWKKKKKHHTRMRVPFLIHNAIHSVNTCQLTDFLFPIAYEKIMAVGLRVNSPININSPWSSWNISSMPVFQHKLTPFLSPNDALQQGEKETAHLYILFMLIKWSLIHTRHLNWH